jgi:STE24 endopeptidase
MSGIVTAVPTYRRIKADPAEFFDPAEVKKAKDYQRPLTVARAISLLISAVFITVVLLTGAAGWLTGTIVGSDANWVLRLLVVVVASTLAYSVLALPISIWTTFSHEKKWGFSTETPKGFVTDEVKGFVLGVVLEFVVFGVLFWVIRSTPLWWLWGWLAFFVIMVGLAMIFPIVLAPIFNRFTPLEDEALNARIHSIVEGAGMSLGGVQVMDASKRTKKDNAYFAGIGKTRRVVIYDNLLEQPHEVIGSIVAHELGHWRRKHVARGVMLATATTLLLFGALYLVSTWDGLLDLADVASLGEPEALPLILVVFTIVQSVTGIAQAWVSRAYERQADLDSLELTRDHDAFVETHRGLSTRNLSDLVPSWFKYIRSSHPPAAERLQLGKLWLQAQDVAQR